MSDNEEGRSASHIAWIQNLITEAEAPIPAPAPKPVIPTATKRRIRPEVVILDGAPVATYIADDGMAVYKPLVATGGWGW